MGQKYSREYYEFRDNGFSHEEALERADQAILDDVENELDEDELYLLEEIPVEESDSFDFDDEEDESFEYFDYEESYDPFNVDEESDEED